MILRKIRQLLSNPFIHFPVWHFDSISSYNINSFSLEDQTMQIIINTAFPVQPTKNFHPFYAPLVISKTTNKSWKSVTGPQQDLPECKQTLTIFLSFANLRYFS